MEFGGIHEAHHTHLVVHLRDGSVGAATRGAAGAAAARGRQAQGTGADSRARCAGEHRGTLSHRAAGEAFCLDVLLPAVVSGRLRLEKSAEFSDEIGRELCPRMLVN